MNKKFFKKYSIHGYSDGCWVTFAVVSDGEIIPDPDWREAEETLYPEWTTYQCYNPRVCAEDYMEKQRRIDELQSRVSELKSEQSILNGLIGSKMPINRPVLFGDIVATMDEEGTILFQKAILPTDL